MAEPFKFIQDYVDNNQAAINSLNQYNPLKYAAQGVQDIANVVAHPVKTAKDAVKAGEKTMRQIAQNPKKAIPDMVKNAISNNEYKDIAKDPKLYVAKKTGGTLTDIMLAAAASGGAGTLGKGAAKALPKTTLKTMTPVTSSMGGDAIKGSSTSAKHLGFPARIAEDIGGVPEQSNRNIQATLLREARNNPTDATSNNAYGLTQFNSKDVSIAKNTPSQLSTGEHEAWHALVRNVEDMQDATGYIDPRYLKFQNEVTQAIGQPVGRLSDSETLAYAIQKLQNPNYAPNWGVINSEGVSKQQFDNLIKTMQPRYNRFLFDRRHK